MPFFDPIRIGASGATASAGLSINRSLRFSRSGDPKLVRTATSTSNTFTFSTWLKRASFSTFQYFFSVGGTGLLFNTDDGIRVYSASGSNTSTAKFRDPNAWYHVVLSMNSGSATVYVNNIAHLTSVAGFSLSTSTNYLRVGFLAGSAGEFNFDGYLAETHLIDGSALTPSSFAETDSLTGEWNPKKYVGGYGTSGFLLNYSDNSSASALGTDSSGNNNNFTPYNFSVAAGVGNDSVTDTPSNNFMTWNPSYIPQTASVAHQNGNLDWNSTAGGDFRDARANFHFNSGKWYCEVQASVYSAFGTGTSGVGISVSNTLAGTLTNYLGSSTNLGVGYFANGAVYINGSFTTGHGAYGLNAVIGMAIDFDNLKIYFHKDGTYINSGNPTAGSGGFSIVANNAGFVVACSSYGTITWSLNSGQIKTDSTSYADDNGFGAFKYAVPSGYKAMCTENIPDPAVKLPNEHFETLTYTGNGSTNAVTGLQFKPDLVWLKRISGGNNGHRWHDVIRGAGLHLRSDSTAVDNSSTALTSFDSNGFTVTGNDGNGNLNNSPFVAWNFNAGETDGKTYAVTVVSDSGNKYRFDGFGTSAVTLDLAEGGTYVFDWSDSSAQSHPVRFSTTADGTHGGGTEYTTGVVKDDSAYKTTITVAASAPTLYYYCQNHSGMGGQVDTNSTLGSSNFDGALQSTVKANPTAGFSIVQWTSGGSDATVGHGLGVKPTLTIQKRHVGSTSNWNVYYDFVDGSYDYIRLNSDSYSLNSSAALPTSTVFTQTWGSGTMMAYVFSQVEGFSKFDFYVGNGSTTGTYVHTGFRPAFVLMKRISTTTGFWSIYDNKRATSNVMDNILYAHLANAEASGSTAAIDFLSNGFMLRNTSAHRNQSDKKYLYLAFAESPFKYARAR